MRKIVYDVAVSLDGFISHEDGSVDGFLMEGEHVAEYVERLKGYDTVLMGKRTYEWGYPFGLVPGKRAYPHMEHHIFSRTLRFDEGAEVQVVDRDEVAVVEGLKASPGADIYLCGGGAFAGFLLDHALIDQLVLKLNPIVFGHGVRLFGGSTRKVALALVGSKPYANSAQLLRYDVKYGRAA
ncbi:dihydrofolate reductase [Sorangium cellulosum]|uniref:Dihydrofolate reductase n=1 Tax=Sorangium cellulosum TaxID=56 RepID=A0A150S4E0_SORCE|nr:dihydrofolate reductase [Sorangium cellulosum]KYF94812.1 dihydrofolate reductase [Sorangium cellulosum]